MPSDSDRDDNPYAPPQSDVLEGSSAFTTAKVERKCLVVPRVWQSPPICLLSGTLEDLVPAKPMKQVAVVPVIVLLLLSAVGAVQGKMGASLYLLAASFACALLPGGPNLFRLFGRTDVRWFYSRNMKRRRRWQLRIRLLVVAAAVIAPKLSPSDPDLYIASFLLLPLVGFTRLMVPEFLTARITSDTVSFLGLAGEVMEKIVQLDLTTKAAVAAGKP